MKRILLQSILATLFTASAVAAPISRNEAIVLAGNFLSKQNKPAAHKSQINKRLRVTSESSSHSPYYIINIGNDEGYVVVAGDDRARTILAYSDKGSLDNADMPEACRFWLSQYSIEINSLSKEEGSYNASEYPASEKTEVIEPLIQTKWDQKYPYNMFCPETAYGLRCVTGCVATATAQVMRYYSYPTQATGKVVYADKNQEIERTLDFSTLDPFDWDNMTLEYNEYSNAAQCNAVANLMKAVGYGVKMQYSPETSMAYHRSSGEALINYFGYDKNLHLYERALMSSKEWEDIILSELSAGRPIIYDGRNPDMGHTFICDGYDGNGLYHFNWGWSGLSDGYFSLTALNPGQQSTGGSTSGYNDNQAIVCNIAPAGREDSESQRDYLLTINILYLRDAISYHVAANTSSLETTMADSQFFFDCFHKGYGEFNGEIWAAIKDDNKITPIIRAVPLNSESENISGGGYNRLSFPLKNSGLADGTYTIGFFYKRDATDGWHTITATPDQPIECLVTVKGDNITFQPQKNTPDEGSGIKDVKADKAEIKINGKEIAVTSPKQISEVSIYNLNGQKLMSEQPGCNETQINTSSFTDGIYILFIRSIEGDITTLKIKI